MATHKSALKAHRQNVKRRLRNRHHRSRLRSVVKRMRSLLAQGEVEQAREMLPGTLSLIDRTAKLNAIHVKSASRAKSRLTRAVNRAVQSA